DAPVGGHTPPAESGAGGCSPNPLPHPPRSELRVRAELGRPISPSCRAERAANRPCVGGHQKYKSTCWPSPKIRIHFRTEPLRPSYIFAIQASPVTVITKNTNAVPIFLFVC